MKWYAYDGGAIVARYEHAHPGLVELADDHPDVLAFLNPSAPIPQEVSRFQAKAALALAGKLTEADAAVQASGDIVLQLAWESATVFRRDSPGIAALAGGIGLNNAALDDLFRTASGIVA